MELGDVETAPQHQSNQGGFARLNVWAAQNGGNFLIMTQSGKGSFGNFVAVLATEFFMVFEIMRQNRIGRLPESQNIGQNLAAVLELSGIHNAIP